MKLRTATAVLALAGVIALLPAAPAQAEAATTIVNNGPASNRVDIAIVGDGYTAAQMAAYHADVSAMVDGLFAQEPFREYKRYFNVQRVDVVSAQSGADHPERVPARIVNTALDATYNCAQIQRLICVDHAKVQTVLGRSLQPAQYDIQLVLVNDPEYGGSGGAVAVASTHASVVELVLHELGHSFGLLTDEYGGGSDSTCGLTEPNFANATASTARDQIKWRSWIGTSTPVPTLTQSSGQAGAYVGASYCDDGVYRPTPDSKMRSLGRPFEQINTEQLVKRIYAYVSPIDSVSPAAPTLPFTVGGSARLSVSPLVPASHALRVEWSVDGNRVATGNSYLFDFASLAVGTHVVKATVTDETTRVRNDPERLLTESATWTVDVDTAFRRFTAKADALVNASKPKSNYGHASGLKAQGKPGPMRSYMKFAVSGLSGPASTATLRMVATEASDMGGYLRLVGYTGWSESKIVYKKSPKLGTTISVAGRVARGNIVEFDVTSAIVGNGTYSFAITSASGDKISYSSSEGASPPQIVVQ